MILNGHVRFRISGRSPCLEMRRKHQKTDVVKQGGQFQLMQELLIEVRSKSHTNRNCCRFLAMACLPRQESIQFLTDLPDQDAFEIAPRCGWKMKALDLLQHTLNLQHGWFNVICYMDVHHITSEKTQSPRTAVVILGSG